MVDDTGAFAFTRGARRLRYVALASMVLMVATALFAVVATATDQTDPAKTLSFAMGATSAATQLAGTIVTFVTASLFATALWQLARMLRCLEQGEAFGRRTVRHLRGFALWVFATALSSLMLPVVANVGLGLLAGAETDRLTITISGGDLFMPLFSGLLYLVARLLEQAQRLADENRQII
jgi:hypothetical protein